MKIRIVSHVTVIAVFFLLLKSYNNLIKKRFHTQAREFLYVCRSHVFEFFLKEAMMQKHLFVFNLIDNFRQIIESIDNQSSVDYELIRYCERFLEFLVDLEVIN